MDFDVMTTKHQTTTQIILKMNKLSFKQSVLKQAQALQKEYTRFGVSTTQNVRNPFTMKQLVESMLPVLPDPECLIQGKVTIEVDGESFTSWTSVLPQHRLPKDFYTERAMSIEDLEELITSSGFLVNCRQTLAGELHKHPNVRSIWATQEQIEERRALKEKRGETSTAGWDGNPTKLNGEKAKPKGRFSFKLYYLVK